MRIARHPVHPMLVHFPIAFWTTALGADLIGIVRSTPLVSTTAFWACALGCASGAAAMLAGVFDYRGLPDKSPARDTAVNHLMTMCGAWAVYFFSLVLRGYPAVAPTPPSAVVATLVGFVALAVGARSGGKLVYEFGVGQSRSSDASKKLAS